MQLTAIVSFGVERSVNTIACLHPKNSSSASEACATVLLEGVRQTVVEFMTSTPLQQSHTQTYRNSERMIALLSS